MLSKGQRTDFTAYMGTGTAALWLLGGLATGWAAPVILACAAGAAANRRTRGANEPIPLEFDQNSQSQEELVIESRMRQQYGEQAVYAYRENRAAGQNPQVACRSVIYDILQLQE